MLGGGRIGIDLSNIMLNVNPLCLPSIIGSKSRNHFMNLQTFKKTRNYAERIDPEVIRRRKRPRDRGIGLWFISVQTDLKRLLAHRGAPDSVIEIYLRVPDLIFRSNSTAIGEEVELTFQERTSLGITSLRPSDIPWRKCRRLYKIERNRRKRERATVLRRRAGVRPLSESLSRTKPWETEGISRSTWYTRRKQQLDNRVLPPSYEEVPATDCPIQPTEEKEVATKKAKKADNDAFHAEQLEQISPAILEMMKNGNGHDLSEPERIEELEETVKTLEVEIQVLRAQNKLFEEMKTQWRDGGFGSVIAGKNEEIRALLIRVASESRDKAKNLRSSDYWKAEAIKLGYRRNGET
jgi:hypothetical protein